MANVRVRAHFPNGGFGYVEGSGRKRHGAEFNIPEDQLANWMVPVGIEPEPEPEPAKKSGKSTAKSK
jgi:hypothetical protein